MLRNSPAQSALSPFNVRGIMATGVIRQGDYRYENLVFFSGIAAVILAYVFVGFARSYYLAGLFKARLPSSRVERWILRNQKPDSQRWRQRITGSAIGGDESGTAPANPLAAVTAVKAAEPDIREQQVQLFRQVLAQCRKDFRV